MGVQVFFVLSGFVIPWSVRSLVLTGHTMIRFLVRRLVRLDPPYLVAIALSIGLGYFSTLAPGFAGEPFLFSWAQLLAHFGYLNAFLDYDWYNPVFWTLAIEFQWYVLVGFLQPVFLAKRRDLFYCLTAVLAATSFLFPSGNLIFASMPLFLLGVAGFRYRSNLASAEETGIFVAALALLGKFTVGTNQTLVGIATLAVILLVRVRWRPLIFIGSISYSLYLVHVPIGGRVINLAGRLPMETGYRFMGILVALVSSIVAAYLMWKFVELPAQRWSRRIRYK